MKATILIPGLIILSLQMAKAQVQVRWYQVDDANYFEVKAAPSGSNIAFYSKPQGGKVLRNETADSDGQVTVKGDESFLPAFALNNGENGSGTVTFYGEKAFALQDLDINSEHNKVSITWKAGVSHYDQYEFELQKSDNGVDFERMTVLPAVNKDLVNYYAADEMPEHVSHYRVRLINTQTGSVAYTWRTVMTSQEMQVYPTPAQNELHILLKSDNPKHYHIVNTTGQIVLEGVAGQSHSIVDIAKLTPGNYVLFIDEDGGEKVSRKFVKL